jgi:hypothetical protein
VVSENVAYQVILQLSSMVLQPFAAMPFVMPLQTRFPARAEASAYYLILAGISRLPLAFLASASLTILVKS